MFKEHIRNDLYLSLLQMRHAEELFQLIDSSRSTISEWLSFPGNTNSAEDSRTFIEKSLKRFSSNNGFWAGIWYQGKLAGSIGFLYLDHKNKKTEIGYWLGNKFEGRGLVTSSCQLLIRHAFEELRLRKVELNMAVKNTKSRAVPERLGFTQEGIIRSYEYINGDFHDRVFYGLLKEEWKGLQQPLNV
ncbi:GNAT family N-acetyltransferase [Peribacillus kribbensis]|uniref:GNAT family N-acetyltransferase n=1 Tax=Peribacillus kribbensis TaxID=356658 RepID=UPI0003FB0ABA|nr:GNAT family protein [Peribacillus kribbensis]